MLEWYMPLVLKKGGKCDVGIRSIQTGEPGSDEVFISKEILIPARSDANASYNPDKDGIKQLF
jgi:hypothetical protein